MEYKTETVDITQLKPNPQNPRTFTKDGIERLKKQITKLSQYKPIIVDTRTGLIVGGHGRYEALKLLGIKDVLVSYITSKDDAEALEYALSDNDRAGAYSDDLLANLIPNYTDFPWADYSVDIKEPTNLQELIDKFSPTEEDEVPEVSTDPAISKYGEVYRLGRHKIGCLDATKIEDVEKLMGGQKADMVFTDPPYNVNLKYESYKDTKSKSEYVQFSHDWFTVSTAVSPKQIVFVGNINNKMWIKEFDPDYVGIWDKGNAANTHGYITNYTAWEPIFFHGKFERKRHTDVWNISASEGEHIEHACPKPIKLLADILNNFSEKENSILDVFLGSGSTLIACEQTNRICLGLEVDPKYVDVCRKRYHKFKTGDTTGWVEGTPKIE